MFYVLRQNRDLRDAMLKSVIRCSIDYPRYRDPVNVSIMKFQKYQFEESKNDGYFCNLGFPPFSTRRRSETNMAPEIQVFATESDVCAELCRLIEKKAQETLNTDKNFRIGLSGGSLVKMLCQGLPKIHSEWNRWQLFFCDERLLPFDDPESSFGVYRRELIGKVPLSENQFVVIDPALPVEAAAKDYESKLRQSFGDVPLPRFDLLLLGMGPDGHTCSLFPGHKALQEQSTWVTSIADSPKPPPCRVTLTLPVVNNAKCCIFPIAGGSKADTIHRILDKKEQFPAGMVQPKNGELYWLLDKNAASDLKSNI